MKATGIVRRIDDLGRVVIPKEIRRTLRIREGDPLEIYTEKDGGVIWWLWFNWKVNQKYNYEKDFYGDCALPCMRTYFYILHRTIPSS